MFLLEKQTTRRPLRAYFDGALVQGGDKRRRAIGGEACFRTNQG